LERPNAIADAARVPYTALQGSIVQHDRIIMAVENYTTTYSQPDHLDFKRRLLSDHARALALAGPIRLVKCIFVLAYKVQCTLHQDNPVLRLEMHL
jgi:hypothetical protein